MQSLHPAQELAIWAIPVLFAITLHEAAHGWAANRLGDPTARMLGRITLNPFKHIDPVGTILVPLVSWFAGGIKFGWAKPVPVTPQNLRRHRHGMAIVAIAGPLANVLQWFLWALLLVVLLRSSGALGWVEEPLGLMAKEGIKINIVLALLNLLPLLPLDGGRIVDQFLPGPLSARFAAVEPWGLWIVLGLAVTGVLWLIIGRPYISLIRLTQDAVNWMALR